MPLVSKVESVCLYENTHTTVLLLRSCASIEAAVISMEEPCKRCRAAGSCITFTAWGEAACVEPACVCVLACVCARVRADADKSLL